MKLKTDREILNFIREATRGTFNLDLLYGPQSFPERAEIAADMLNVDHATSKMGQWDNFRRTVYSWLGIPAGRDCAARTQRMAQVALAELWTMEQTAFA